MRIHTYAQRSTPHVEGIIPEMTPLRRAVDHDRILDCGGLAQAYEGDPVYGAPSLEIVRAGSTCIGIGNRSTLLLIRYSAAGINDLDHVALDVRDHEHI